jgi:hypothetical protein
MVFPPYKTLFLDLATPFLSNITKTLSRVASPWSFEAEQLWSGVEPYKTRSNICNKHFLQIIAFMWGIFLSHLALYCYSEVTLHIMCSLMPTVLQPTTTHQDAAQIVFSFRSNYILRWTDY